MKENFIMFLTVLFILALFGGIGYGIYKLMNKVGIKPASKKTGDQCAVNIECASSRCIVGKCL
jgi:flagellar biogenesis protein FliO